MQKQAVCFDLGGVLIRVEQRWSEVLARAEVHATRIPDSEFRLGDFRALEDLQEGLLDNQGYFDLVQSTFGLPSLRCARHVHEAILIEEMSGVFEFVQSVKSAGFTVGCLSNTNGLHWELLNDVRRFPVIAEMDVAVLSHECQLAKPDAEFYREFEQRSGCQGDSIWFFDDTHINVVGAKRVGWNAHRIDPTADTASQMRAIVAGSQLRA